MLGSIYCMHWTWNNCSMGWISWLKRVVKRSNNRSWLSCIRGSIDLTFIIWIAWLSIGFECVVKITTVRSCCWRCPSCNYVIKGRQYTMDYYLAHGFYPSMSTFVKTIARPQGNKRLHFATHQESIRKRCSETYWCAAEALCHCSWPSQAIEPTDPMANNGMLHHLVA